MTYVHVHVLVCTCRNAVENTTPLSPSLRNITTHQDSQHTSSHRPLPPAPATCEHRVLRPLDTSSPPAQIQSEKTSDVKRKKDSIYQKDVLPEREDENCVQQKREPPEKPSLRSGDRSSGPVWRNARKQLVRTAARVHHLFHGSVAWLDICKCKWPRLNFACLVS